MGRLRFLTALHGYAKLSWNALTLVRSIICVNPQGDPQLPKFEKVFDFNGDGIADPVFYLRMQGLAASGALDAESALSRWRGH